MYELREKVSGRPSSKAAFSRASPVHDFFKRSKVEHAPNRQHGITELFRRAWETPERHKSRVRRASDNVAGRLSTARGSAIIIISSPLDQF